MTEQPKKETKPEQPQQAPQSPQPSVGVGIPPVTVNLSLPISEKKAEAAPTAPKAYKAIVITETCPFCQGLKDYIKEQGLTEKVKFINASTPEGRKFAIEHDIRGVPECVVVEADGKKVKVCSKEEFVKLLKEGT